MPWGKHGMQHKEELASFVGSCETKTVALGRPFFVCDMFGALQRFDSSVERVVIWLNARVGCYFRIANDASCIQHKRCAD